jgi:predicted CXXCH cytochrome family protein
MRCLIRNVVRRTQTGTIYDDKSYEGFLLSLGRGTDQDVLLSDIRVALAHAQIAETRSGEYVFQAKTLSGIVINDQPVQTKRLEIDDVIAIANYRLTIVTPPTGYDFAFEVETVFADVDEKTSLETRSTIGLKTAGLSKRTPSMILFVSILFLFLFLPLSGMLHSGWANTLRMIPMFNDASWLSGDLASVHHIVGSDCNTCHSIPFVKVRNTACLSCHAQTEHHVNPAEFNLASITETRCASCHREHNEPSNLVRRDQALCSQCHDDLERTVAATDLLNASDFGRDHPEFRPSIMTNTPSGGAEIRRVALGTADLRSGSGLKFNHKIHLGEEGVLDMQGHVQQLACVNCHATETGGQGMLPFTMESQCQRCHSLDFDTAEPDREVPHADPEVVMRTLEDFYNAQALKGGYRDASAPEFVRQLRRPGQPLSETEQKEALEWAAAKWTATATQLFEYRTCNTCHEVERVSDSLWKIAPVTVTHRWFPMASFDHSRHSTMKCVDCHQADLSESSAEVLLPSISVCRDCHGGGNAENKLASDCVSCHDFHIAEGMLMSKKP